MNKLKKHINDVKSFKKSLLLVGLVVVLWYALPSTTYTNIPSLQELFPDEKAKGMAIAMTTMFFLLGFIKNAPKMLNIIRVLIGCLSILFAVNSMNLENINDGEIRITDDVELTDLKNDKRFYQRQIDRLTVRYDSLTNLVKQQTDIEYEQGAREWRKEAQLIAQDIRVLRTDKKNSESLIAIRQSELKASGSKTQQSLASIFFVSSGSPLLRYLINIFFAVINDALIYASTDLLTRYFPFIAFQYQRKRKYRAREVEKLLAPYRVGSGRTRSNPVEPGRTVSTELEVGRDGSLFRHKHIPTEIKDNVIVNIALTDCNLYHRDIGRLAADRLGLDEPIPRSTVTTILNKNGITSPVIRGST